MIRRNSNASEKSSDSHCSQKSALQQPIYTTVQLTANIEGVKNLPHLWPGTQIVMEWTEDSDDSKCIKSELKRHLSTTQFTPIVIEWKLRRGKHGRLLFDHGKSVEGKLRLKLKKFSDSSFKEIGMYRMNPEALLHSYFADQKWQNREKIKFGNKINATLCTCIEVVGRNNIEEAVIDSDTGDPKNPGVGFVHRSLPDLRFKDPTASDFRGIPNRFDECDEGTNTSKKRAHSFEYGVPSCRAGRKKRKDSSKLQRTLSDTTHDDTTILSSNPDANCESKKSWNSALDEQEFETNRRLLYLQALDDEIKENAKFIDKMKEQIIQIVNAPEDNNMGANEMQKSVDPMRADYSHEDHTNNSIESSKNTVLVHAMKLHFDKHRPEACRIEVLRSADRDISESAIALIRKVWKMEVKKVEEIHLPLPAYLNHAECDCLKQPTEDLERSVVKFFKVVESSHSDMERSEPSKPWERADGMSSTSDLKHAKKDHLEFADLVRVIRSMRSEIKIAETKRKEGKSDEGDEQRSGMLACNRNEQTEKDIDIDCEQVQARIARIFAAARADPTYSTISTADEEFIDRCNAKLQELKNKNKNRNT